MVERYPPNARRARYKTAARMKTLPKNLSRQSETQPPPQYRRYPGTLRGGRNKSMAKMIAIPKSPPPCSAQGEGHNRNDIQSPLAFAGKPRGRAITQ